jgi:hypothetical protein
MSNATITRSSLAVLPTIATSSVAARPVAARTTLLLEGPVLATLLRLAAPNILNLLAVAGMRQPLVLNTRSTGRPRGSLPVLRLARGMAFILGSKRLNTLPKGDRG